MHIYIYMGFPGGSVGKSAYSEGDLGWEGGHALKEGMETYSSILAWRMPIDRRVWRATAHGVTELDMTGRLSTHTHIHVHPHPANRSDYLARLVLKIKKLYTHTIIHTHTHTYKIALPGNHFYWKDKHIKTKKGEEMTCLWLQCFF